MSVRRDIGLSMAIPLIIDIVSAISPARANVSGSSSMRPASIFEKSSTSLTMVRSARPEPRMRLSLLRSRGSSGPASSSSSV